MQTPERDARAARIGSCRDSAWLLVRHAAPARARRALRLRLPRPARARPTSRSTGRRARPTDFTDLHAWAEVYIPGAGWIGLDADLRPARRRGPHPARLHARTRTAAAPITGTRRTPRRTTLEFSNERPPRPRAPARHAALQRRAVETRSTRSAERVDDDAASGRRPADDGRRADLRLDRRHGGARVEHRRARRRPSARSPRDLAERLARALRARRRSSSTARASGTRARRCRAGRSACYWRTDGQPLWRDRGLLADPAAPGSATTPSRPQRLVAGDRGTSSALPADVPLAARTRIRSSACAAEARLPAGDPPVGDRRRRSTPVASATPTPAPRSSPRSTPTRASRPAARCRCTAASATSRWATGHWRLRRGALYLRPGRLADRVCGCRSPRSPGPRRRPTPSARRSPRHAAARARRTPATAAGRAHGRRRRSPTPARREPTRTSRRPITALCVELRDGHVARLPAAAARGRGTAVELVAAVEDAAADAACRSSSRATRRRRTRSSATSTSRPTPA